MTSLANKIFSAVWRSLTVVGFILANIFFSSQMGWSGAEVVFRIRAMGLVETIITFVFFAVSAVVVAAVTLGIFRVSRTAFWLTIPISLYCALVLGVWDGYVSGFDSTRAALLKERVDANAYALRHMTAHGRDLTCREGRIDLSDEAARAICRSTLSGNK